MPAPGHITEYEEPEGEGVRVDSGVQANWDITPYYDPMVAKISTHGDDREQARQRMIDALERYTIGGLTQNKAMHLDVLTTETFKQATYDTGWLEAHQKEK